MKSLAWLCVAILVGLPVASWALPHLARFDGVWLLVLIVTALVTLVARLSAPSPSSLDQLANPTYDERLDGPR